MTPQPNQPAPSPTPTPELDPDHRARPGFFPPNAPEVKPNDGSEFERGVSPPEVLPDSSPVVTPPMPPNEIPSPTVG